MHRIWIGTLVTTACLSTALAQNSSTLIEAGYTDPAVPEVAPGQVVTLYFRGVKRAADGSLRSGKAAGLPLPETLAGIGAKLWQDGRYIAMPALSLRQQDECTAGAQGAGGPECTLTALRVQIPYELNLVTIAGANQDGVPAAQEFMLEEDGRPGRRFGLRPLPDNAHVVTSCDVAGETGSGRLCERSAYHADGRIAGVQAPVRRGDTVIVYAYGLGPTYPFAETGKPAPRDARIPESGRRRLWVNLLDSPLNASGSLPRGYHPDANPRTAIATDFTGLTPGAAGLYQVNVRIPDTFRPALACGPEVRSNALLLVTTERGTESVPLCVAE